MNAEDNIAVAEEIYLQHRAMEDGSARYVRNAVDIGELLTELKFRLPNSEFRSLIEQHCRISYDIAERYITVARVARADLKACSFALVIDLLAEEKQPGT